MSALQNNTPAESQCSVCDQTIAGRSLKCGGAGKPGCGKFTHLKCSELPAYMLVKFEKTRTIYHCPRCVAADVGEAYEECLSRVQRELQEENEQPVDPNSIEPSISQDQEREEPVNRTGGETENESQNRRKKVCKYYNIKACKYGARGNVGGICPFRHPKKCLKYIRHGDRSNRGCKKGSGCDDHHPPLCFNSLKHGWCDRQSCKYHHLQGTKFIANSVRESNARASEQPRVNTERNERRNERSYVNAARGFETRREEREEDPGAFNYQQNFMTLSHQIYQMQAQIQRLLERDREAPMKNWPPLPHRQA